MQRVRKYDTEWLMATLVTGGEVKEMAWTSSIKIDADVWFVTMPIGRSPMSLKSLPIPPMPEEVARVAHTVFPRGNVFMQVRDATSNDLH